MTCNTGHRPRLIPTARASSAFENACEGGTKGESWSKNLPAQVQEMKKIILHATNTILNRALDLIAFDKQIGLLDGAKERLDEALRSAN